MSTFSYKTRSRGCPPYGDVSGGGCDPSIPSRPSGASGGRLAVWGSTPVLTPGGGSCEHQCPARGADLRPGAQNLSPCRARPLGSRGGAAPAEERGRGTASPPREPVALRLLPGSHLALVPTPGGDADRPLTATPCVAEAGCRQGDQPSGLPLTWGS